MITLTVLLKMGLSLNPIPIIFLRHPRAFRVKKGKKNQAKIIMACIEEGVVARERRVIYNLLNQMLTKETALKRAAFALQLLMFVTAEKEGQMLIIFFLSILCQLLSPRFYARIGRARPGQESSDQLAQKSALSDIGKQHEPKQNSVLSSFNETSSSNFSFFSLQRLNLAQYKKGKQN